MAETKITVAQLFDINSFDNKVETAISSGGAEFSTVQVVDNNVEWQLSAGKSFSIIDSVDSSKFVVKAPADPDSIKIDTSGRIDIDVADVFEIRNSTNSYIAISSGDIDVIANTSSMLELTGNTINMQAEQSSGQLRIKSNTSTADNAIIINNVAGDIDIDANDKIDINTDSITMETDDVDIDAASVTMNTSGDGDIKLICGTGSGKVLLEASSGVDFSDSLTSGNGQLRFTNGWQSSEDSGSSWRPFNNIIKKMIAAESLSAGDPVGIYDSNKLGKIGYCGLTTDLIFHPAIARLTLVAKLTEDIFVIAFRDDSASDRGKARVGHINETGAIDWLTGVTVFETANISDMSIAALTEDTFVITYRTGSDGTAIVGQYAAGSITWKTGKIVFNGSINGYTSVARLDDDTFVVAYQVTYGTARIGQYTGATINWLTSDVEFNSALTEYIDTTALTSDTFVIVYRDAGNSGYGTAIIGKYTGGTDISWETDEVVYNEGQSYYNTVAALTNDTFVVAYKDAGTSDYGTARVGQYSKAFGTDMTWAHQTSSFDTSHILGICHNGSDLWVAGGQAGKLASSPDGITWIQRDSKFGASSWVRRVAYSVPDSLWLIVGLYNKASTSSNGIDWTSVDVGFGGSRDVHSAVHNGLSGGSGLWVVVGSNGKLATSPDGTNWTQRTSSFGSTTIYDVAYSTPDSLWVAVGNENTIATSPNGIDWTQQSGPFFGSDGVEGIAHNGVDLWVAVADQGKLATSPDGADWTLGDEQFGGLFLRSVDHDQSGLWIVVAQSGNMTTSPDGINWTPVDSGFGSSEIHGIWYNRLAGDSGQWIAVGWDGKLATSPGLEPGLGWLTSEEVFNEGITNYNSIAILTSDTFAIAYQDETASFYGTIIVGTYTGTGISWQTGETVFNTGASSYTSIVALNNNTFIIAYKDGDNSGYGTVRLGQYVNNSIGWLTPEDSNLAFNEGDTQYTSTAPLSNNIFVVAYRDMGNSNYGTARIGEYNNNSISWLTSEEVFNEADTQYISIARLNNDTFVVAYEDSNGYGTTIIGQYTGTGISWITSGEAFNEATTQHISVATLNSTHFVVAYQDIGAQPGTAIIGQYTGTGIVYGSENIFNSNTTTDISVEILDSTHFVVGYRDGAGNGTARVGATDGSITISSYNTASVFNSASAFATSVATLDSTHFVVAYRDAGNSDYGTVRVAQYIGDIISWLTDEIVFNAASTTFVSVINLKSNIFAIAFADTATTGAIKIGQYDSIIEWLTDAQTFNTAEAQWISASSLIGNMFIVTYKDVGNLDYGTAKAFKFAKYLGLNENQVAPEQEAYIIARGFLIFSNLQVGEIYFVDYKNKNISIAAGQKEIGIAISSQELVVK